jgi:hypothetical protein
MMKNRPKPFLDLFLPGLGWILPDLAKFGVGLDKPNNPDKIRSTPA